MLKEIASIHFSSYDTTTGHPVVGSCSNRWIRGNDGLIAQPVRMPFSWVRGAKGHVRGERELLPVNDPGVTINDIKLWRTIEYEAGRPSSLEDFYACHDICSECRGEGVRMIGWSRPVNSDEIDRATDLGLEELPFYGVCSRCGGSGKRS